MRLNTNTQFISRRLSLLALAAAFAAPLAAPAQAKPTKERQAPAYGPGDGDGNYDGRSDRRRDDGYGDDNGTYDNGAYDNGTYDNGDPRPGYGDANGTGVRGNRALRDLEGVVTRDLGGRRFEMRADDGRVLSVRLAQGELDQPTAGDRVRVSGSLRRGNQNRGNGNQNRGNGNGNGNQGRGGADFVAESLQILSTNGGYNGGNGNYNGSDGRRVSFPATVLNRASARRLSVRGDNGRTYTIESRSNTVRVDDGDRVRVEGLSRNGLITDARVVLLQNNDGIGYGGGYNGGYDAVDGTFLGTVVRVDTRNNQITVRDEASRRTYTFRPKQASDFQVGAQVRATVDVRDGRSVVTKVTRL